MALAFSSLAANVDTTNNPAPTASVNPTAGSVTYLFIAYALFSDGSVTAATDTITPSGARGTWTEIDRVTHADGGVLGRRGMVLFRGTGSVTSEAISITVTPNSGTWTETAWNVIQVTGQDTTTPDDAPVINSASTGTVASTADVGTPGAGDAVLFGVFHETDEAVTATGMTGLGAVTGGTDVRTLHSFYDDTTPDETPQTDAFTSGAWGAIALIVNAAAGGADPEGRLVDGKLLGGGLLVGGVLIN